MVEFDWDEYNISHLWECHRVSPGEAESALSDPRRSRRDAYGHSDEPRRGTLGRTESGRLLLVVWTRRGGLVRVVSARDASMGERRAYTRGWR